MPAVLHAMMRWQYSVLLGALLNRLDANSHEKISPSTMRYRWQVEVRCGV
jgi:hypothetical protein